MDGETREPVVFHNSLDVMRGLRFRKDACRVPFGRRGINSGRRTELLAGTGELVQALRFRQPRDSRANRLPLG